MPADDHLRNLFEEVQGVPEPSPKGREQARRRLYSAMAAGSEPPTRRRRTRSLGWATAVVAAVIIGLVFVVPASTPQVDANLADIAAAARAVDETELPEGAYIYYRIESTALNDGMAASGESFVYLLPRTIDVWVRGTSALRQTTTHQPIFATASDEAAFYAAGLDASEGVGETRTLPLTDIPNEQDVSGLSADVTELRDQIRNELSADDEFEEGNEVRILEHLAALLTPRFNAPPALRGSLLELVGQLDIATQRTAAGGVIVTQGYEDETGSYEQLLEFDATGFLIRNTLTLRKATAVAGVPSGVLSDLHFTVPEMVPEPGVYP